MPDRLVFEASLLSALVFLPLGFYQPFFPLWLAAQNFDAAMIGLVMAAIGAFATPAIIGGRRLKVAATLRQLGIDFASLTYGAGGTSRDTTITYGAELVKMGIPLIGHLTCVGASREEVDEVARSFGSREAYILQVDLDDAQGAELDAHLGEAVTDAPRARAMSWPPRQWPITGTPASTAARTMASSTTSCEAAGSAAL